MNTFDCILMRGDDRLADLGALLVFRHWLRRQIQEMAGLDDAALYPLRFTVEPEAEPQRCGRLFF